MKTLKFGGAAAALLLLTSCLGDGGSTVVQNTTYGVVELSSKTLTNMVCVDNAGTLFYSPELAKDVSVETGDCCILAYTVDHGSPENQNAAANGYYTVTKNGYAELDRWPFNFNLTDTAKIMENEQVIGNIGNAYGYIKGKMFLETLHKDFLTGQKNKYELSYNPSAEPEKIDGNRVYNLYLRTVKMTDGKSPSGNASIPNAYDLQRFVFSVTSTEKAAGAKAIFVRFNYIKEFNKDTTAATWGVSLPYQLPFSE